MLWLIVSRFLLVALGVLLGVSLMCLLQVNRQADEKMNEIQRRNEE
ncbi:DUF3789 domain-containing protein [Listeria monocytogenes]|nr:DUF3789 domain-containing protein [Listeria monocytogenes]EJO7756745.1 DUF3789 domain-containing protein [Listeria monocytogenes]EJT8453481.1 DUF3789 domain-containing protein [Listeria monocytogenes]EJT8454165.1 DUF3789 domain-containing protein [Listeria monocytogenes]ELT7848214.1 DUF3789 domain-containing protein [Listeria monocytogenes]